MIDYSRKYDVSEFSYYVLLNEDSPAYSLVKSGVLNPALSRVEDEYGVVFTELKFGDIPPGARCSYVLYGPVDVLKLSDQEKDYLQRLSGSAKCFVNLISAYVLENGHDSEFYKLNQDKIPLISKQIGANVIYPDNCLGNIRTVDANDVADNIICETVRIKYTPLFDRNLSSSQLVTKIRKYSAEIKQISNLYNKYRLWHRSPTDGAIAIFNSDYVLISQTKTNKTDMEPVHFSLITDFDPSLNTITYGGEKLPSSDGPEFLSLNSFLNLKDIFPNYMIHFHKNEIIRSGHFEDRLTVDKIEYGKFDSGKKMFDEYLIQKKDYLLLREHGVVWWGGYPRRIRALLSLCP